MIPAFYLNLLYQLIKFPKLGPVYMEAGLARLARQPGSKIFAV
jgi:hypothetical protein